jgi:hypothetical protein
MKSFDEIIRNWKSYRTYAIITFHKDGTRTIEIYTAKENE